LKSAIEDTAAAQVTATPTDIQAVTSGMTNPAKPQLTIPNAPLSALSSILSATPTILYEQVFDMIENGLFGNDIVNEIDTLVTGSFNDMNSETNVNPAPNCTIYPQKSCLDAPYTLTEDQLREVIYIPSTFTYGHIPPVIVSVTLCSVRLSLTDVFHSLFLAQEILDIKPSPATTFRCFRDLQLLTLFG
jgi:hypothetical protein